MLAERRRSRGLSQEELAERAGLHRTFVSRVERGVQAPSLLAIYYLALALQVAPSELVRQVEDRIEMSPGRRASDA